jgi:hypothetical protein
VPERNLLGYAPLASARKQGGACDEQDRPIEFARHILDREWVE